MMSQSFVSSFHFASLHAKNAKISIKKLPDVLYGNFVRSSRTPGKNDMSFALPKYSLNKEVAQWN